jgi:hypothetical protein
METVIFMINLTRHGQPMFLINYCGSARVARFSNQKYIFKYILEGRVKENIGIFVYFMVIWYSLLSFGIFCGILV